MKSLFTLVFGVLVTAVPAQNPGNAGGPAANSWNDPGSFDTIRPMQELAPPVRPGRRGGVYITGSTAPSSATWTSTNNAVGATGSGVRSNSGYGTGSLGVTNAAGATNRAGVTNVGAITNSAVALTNTEVDPTTPQNFPGAGIIYPPVLPAPVPPGIYPSGIRTGNGASAGTANGGGSTLGGGTISAPPPPGTFPFTPAAPRAGAAAPPPRLPSAPGSLPAKSISPTATPPGSPPPIVTPPQPPGRATAPASGQSTR